MKKHKKNPGQTAPHRYCFKRQAEAALFIGGVWINVYEPVTAE